MKIPLNTTGETPLFRTLNTATVARILSFAALVAVFCVTPFMTIAQERAERHSGSPTPTHDQTRVDLAAMALDSFDIPPEFQLFQELYVPGDSVSAVLLGGQVPQQELDSIGLLWFYQSSYAIPSGSLMIRSYVEQYSTEIGAAESFAILEDELRFETSESELRDEPGPDWAEKPSETTIGIDTSSGAEVVTSIDTTFRHGKLVAGVSVQAFDGSPVEEELAATLAESLDQRVRAVLGGQALPMIDNSLAGQIASLGNDWSGINAGYQSATEFFGPEVGAALESSFVSGYVDGHAFGHASGQGFPMPRVIISIGQLADESAALQALSQLDAILPPFIGLEEVEIDHIPGASASVGYQFANGFFGLTEIDSFRVVMLVDNAVVTVDTMGNTDAESAKNAALVIAKAQVSCMRGDSCAVPPLPADLFDESSGTPVPEPVG